METLNKVVKPNGLGPSPGTFVPPVSSPSMPVLPRHGIDPHSVAQKKKLSKPARAVLGAEILDGNVTLLNPTRDMVSKAVGVSTAYIDAARRLTPEARRDVVHGNRPVVRPKAPPSPVLSVEQRLAAIVAEIGVTAALNALPTIERK